MSRGSTQYRLTKHGSSNPSEKFIIISVNHNSPQYCHADTSLATNFWDPLQAHRVLASKNSLCVQRTVARAYTLEEGTTCSELGTLNRNFLFLLHGQSFAHVWNCRLRCISNPRPPCNAANPIDLGASPI